MEFTGIIKTILPTQTGEGKNGSWSKTTVKIEGEGQFPESFAIDFFNKPEELAKIYVGAEVTIKFNAKCNEYGGKLYNGLLAWSVVPVGGQNAAKTPQNANTTGCAPPAPPTMQESEQNDLPF